MTVFAYLRVSTDQQDLDNQVFGIETYCREHGIVIDEMTQDSVSSKIEWQKRGIGKIVAQAKEGDWIIATEVSRLARNAFEVMEIMKIAAGKKVSVFTIKENLRMDSSIQSQIIAFTFGMSAQIERSFIVSRTKEALAARKAAGKKLGRPAGSRNKELKLDPFEKEIRHYLQLGLPKTNIAKICGTDPKTVYTWCKKRGITDDDRQQAMLKKVKQAR